ncbi:glycosyltransferase [uncultured Pseudokineococcus sp.]|uniref:glycosyltransferase n=1 Tax=uncultured Pseudokineococcus sp. TaxID=1642928 RepID=UPI002626E40C|nr:glycosyltransferase [uncultured Pseudokineococcus sp.]
MPSSGDDVVTARPRRLLLLTAGSRGDLEPFVALAREAARRGHEVVLGATRSMTTGMVGEPAAEPFRVVVLDGDLGSLVARQGVSPAAALRAWRSTVHPALRALLASAVATARDVRPDVVVAHPKVLSAPLAAAVLDVPHVLVETVPALTATGAFPAAGVAAGDLGRRLNRLTYRATAAAGAALGPDLRRLRVAHGLPAGALAPPAAVLCPVSPVLVPRPADWPGTAHLTGPWHDDDVDAVADPQVEAFLTAARAAGAPVVVAGFGSMATGPADAEARSRAVVAAARAHGAHLLVLTGWGGLDARAAREAAGTSGDVLVASSAPHAAVLPRADVVVHHGGAGTVHAVARAGAVSVVVPFVADQPWWARRLHHLDLAPAPLPARRLTADGLARRLAAAPAHRRAARAAAGAMAGERGSARAVDLLEGLT